MAITLVGSSGASAIAFSGGSPTLTFSTGAAAANDVVVVAYSVSRAITMAVLSSDGTTPYTQIGTTISNGNLNTSVWYKVLTSSEVTATCSGTGNGQDGVSAVCLVFRNSSGPIDTSNSTVGASSQPNSPAVSVARPNDAIISAVGSLAAPNTVTAPSGFSNLVTAASTDTRSTTTAISWATHTGSSSYDPTAYSSFTSANWVAFTIALLSTAPPPPVLEWDTSYRAMPDFTTIEVSNY